MSDQVWMMALLTANLALGMWFSAYCARKSVESIQASTRALQIVHDILNLHCEQETEDDLGGKP